MQINKRVIFAKPLRLNVREGFEYKPSIVAYKKAMWEVKCVGRVKRHPVALSYKHFLYINLWIIELYFDWITKAKDYANK